MTRLILTREITPGFKRKENGIRDAVGGGSGEGPAGIEQPLGTWNTASHTDGHCRASHCFLGYK
jgi:hypothetical protein